MQAFARPPASTLQSTDANQAVEGTLEVLGGSDVRNSAPGRNCAAWPPAQVDHTGSRGALQPLHQRPERHADGGTSRACSSYALGSKDEDQMAPAAIDVSDTGVGIWRVNLERIFASLLYHPRRFRRHRARPRLRAATIPEWRPHQESVAPGPGHDLYRRLNCEDAKQRRRSAG